MASVSVFISHILLNSISKSLCLDNFSMNFAEVSLSDGTAMSMSMHLLSSLSSTTMSGLLAFISPKCVHRHIPEYCGLAVTVVGWCSYHFSVVSISQPLQILDECMLLSCYADKFTLFSLIPGTPRQCCQWTFISYVHALSPLQRVLGHFLRDPGPIDVIKWFCYFNLYYRYVQGRKPPRRGEDLKEVWLGLYCWNPSILTLFKAKCIKIATLFKR